MVGAMKVGGYWSVMPWLLRAAVGGGATMVQPQAQAALVSLQHRLEGWP